MIIIFFSPIWVRIVNGYQHHIYLTIRMQVEHWIFRLGYGWILIHKRIRGYILIDIRTAYTSTYVIYSTKKWRFYKYTHTSIMLIPITIAGILVTNDYTSHELQAIPLLIGCIRESNTSPFPFLTMYGSFEPGCLGPIVLKGIKYDFFFLGSVEAR